MKLQWIFHNRRLAQDRRLPTDLWTANRRTIVVPRCWHKRTTMRNRRGFSSLRVVAPSTLEDTTPTWRSAHQCCVQDPQRRHLCVLRHSNLWILVRIRLVTRGQRWTLFAGDTFHKAPRASRRIQMMGPLRKRVVHGNGCDHRNVSPSRLCHEPLR